MATKKKETWTKYTFADGTYIIVRGLSAAEKKIEERQHGKVVKITKM